MTMKLRFALFALSLMFVPSLLLGGGGFVPDGDGGSSNSTSGTLPPTPTAPIAAGANGFESDDTFVPAAAMVVGQAPTAAPNPASGPSEAFVYSNDMGTWKIVPNAVGIARYHWYDGQNYVDTLSYVGSGRVIDNSGSYLPVGSKVRVWVYYAYDGVQGAYFYLGVNPLPGPPRARGSLYPIYFSYEHPAAAFPERVLTNSGTVRN